MQVFRHLSLSLSVTFGATLGASCDVATEDSASQTTTVTTTPSETTDLDTPAFALCTDTGPSSVVNVSYEADVAPIFQVCLSCHINAGTSLKFDDAYPVMIEFSSEGLPSMNRIQPGSLDESYLWHKLCHTHSNVGGLGTVMPPDFQLSKPEMEVVRSWIVDGAAP